MKSKEKSAAKRHLSRFLARRSDCSCLHASPAYNVGQFPKDTPGKKLRHLIQRRQDHQPRRVMGQPVQPRQRSSTRSQVPVILARFYDRSVHSHRVSLPPNLASARHWPSSFRPRFHNDLTNEVQKTHLSAPHPPTRSRLAEILASSRSPDVSQILVILPPSPSSVI